MITFHRVGQIGKAEDAIGLTRATFLRTHIPTGNTIETGTHYFEDKATLDWCLAKWNRLKDWDYKLLSCEVVGRPYVPNYQI